MGVDGGEDDGGGETGGDGEGHFGDEVGGMGADYLTAEDQAGGGVGDHLHHTFRLSHGEGFAIGAEGGFGDLVLQALRLQLLLGGADHGTLGHGEDGGGDDGEVDVVAHHHCGLSGGGMCQQADAIAVADGEDARDGGLKPVVDDDAAAGDLHATLGEPLGDDGSAPYGHQHHLGFDLGGLPFALEADGASHPFAKAYGGDGSLGVECDAAALEGRSERAHHIAVEHGKNLFAIFYHRDLYAEGGEHGGELHADDTSADDGERLGKHLKGEELGSGDGEVGTLDGERRRLRACGHDDARGGVDGTVGLHLVGPEKAGRSPDDVGTLAEQSHRLAKLLHDGILALHHTADIHRDIALREDDAEGGGGSDIVGHLSRAAESLCGDAPLVEACASEVRLLDEQDSQSLRYSMCGGFVAAGSGADDDNIVGHVSRILLMVTDWGG